MENISEEKVIENLKKCPNFNRCSQNFCPLDLELGLREGSNAANCRWMRNPSKKKINGREFMSGGGVMPNGLLNYVPKANVARLNDASRQRWQDLHNG